MTIKTFRFLILIAIFGLLNSNLISNPSNPIDKQKHALNQKSRHLVLYINPYCPYCSKVLKFIEKKNISIEIKNVSEIENRNQLIAIGGKAQVPCLVINNKALYESNDIIKYLKKNF